jgi:hypothetical protein
MISFLQSDSLAILALVVQFSHLSYPDLLAHAHHINTCSPILISRNHLNVGFSMLFVTPVEDCKGFGKPMPVKGIILL